MLWSPPRPTESDSEAGPSNLCFKKPFLHWASLIAPSLGFHDSSVGKESACYAGDPGSIPRLGKIPGEGIGYPFQYSGLENSMDYIIRHDWVPFTFFFNFFIIFLLYNIVLVLPYINMHLPRVYTCSPSWTPIPSLWVTFHFQRILVRVWEPPM